MELEKLRENIIHCFNLSDTQYFHQAIENDFVLLKEKAIFPQTLHWLTKNEKEIASLLPILQELNTVMPLSEADLASLMNCQYLSYLGSFLTLLKAKKVTLTHELFRSLCQETNLIDLVELADIFILTRETLALFLNKEPIFFLERTPILKLLQKNNSLDEPLLRLICRCPDLYWRKKIIEILS
ncbi:MAG: hypothetical protein EPO11_09065, partial [Gammaproteobacteria bacterium]